MELSLTRLCFPGLAILGQIPGGMICEIGKVSWTPVWAYSSTRVIKEESFFNRKACSQLNL